MFSLDAPMAGSREPLKNLLLEEDGLAAWYGQPTCAHLAFERRHALHCAVSQLSYDQRALCQALAHRPVSALVADGFASRSALYRRLADLRHVLTAYGIGPAWDDFAAT
jgi:RNA polymerase sigma-70 factor (ECF subfamily)